MTLNRFIFVLLLGLALSSFITKDDPVDRIVDSLQKWAEENPNEKVHLHMDKPYYAQGDTIWFKAYIVLGSRHQLSAKSGALYVDLINEKDSVIKQLKLPVTGGTTMGDFVLDDDVNEGSYRIRAYTQWMRNVGEAHFFDQTFMVAGLLEESTNGKTAGKMNSSKMLSLKDSLLKSDVQFFPEGGNVVNGITSRVGFKVTGMNGLGLPVKGVLMDEANKTILNFETLHAGMGSFSFKPLADQVYLAKIVFPDGTEKTVPLPPAASQGYVLGVYQPNPDSILVRINTSEPGQTVTLLVQAGAEALYSSQINLNKTVNSVWLEKKAFPTGIAQFTIFDTQGNPTNERLAFIRTADQLQLKLTAARSSYKSREKVDIALHAKDSKGRATSGSFSVSVIDESKVPVDESSEHTIFSNLLLKSELKGYIERPNYYFSAVTPKVNTALDNLMMTQGYRRFDWNRIRSYAAGTKPSFEAEGLGVCVSGVVKTLGDKPLPNAAVTLMSLKASIFHGTKSDSAGRFRFNDILISDSIKFAVQAKSPKKSNKVEVVLDSVPTMIFGKNKDWADRSSDLKFKMANYIANNKKLDSIYEKTGQLNRVQRLRQINIKVRKPRQLYATQGAHRIPEGHADRTIDMRKEKPFATFGLMLPSLLQGVYFKDKKGMQYPYTKDGEMKIILDGMPLHNFDVEGLFNGTTVELTDIVKLDVITSNMALKAMLNGFDEPLRPVLLIYTKADKRRIIYTPNLVNINPKGFNKARSFYSPKYDVGNNAEVPDLRSTIYWNAGLKTFGIGQTTFSYFNADGPGKYKVIVEGINAEGEIGRQVHYYEVI